MVRTIILLVGLVGPPVWAQNVYVTPGENSPLFSDKPSVGARELRLRPLSVIPAEKVRGAGQALANPTASSAAAKGQVLVIPAPTETAAPAASDLPIIPGLPANPLLAVPETRKR